MELEDKLIYDLLTPQEAEKPLVITTLGMVGCNIGGCIYPRGACADAGYCQGGDPIETN
jgi:hypothetical protein